MPVSSMPPPPPSNRAMIEAVQRALADLFGRALGQPDYFGTLSLSISVRNGTIQHFEQTESRKRIA